MLMYGKNKSQSTYLQLMTGAQDLKQDPSPPTSTLDTDQHPGQRSGVWQPVLYCIVSLM